MDVKSFYTKINHRERREACRVKLKNHESKDILSSVLKKLILIVLKCNVFRFRETTVNYAYSFMGYLKIKIIDEFYWKQVKNR